jgi:membrane protease YdiL (CAAX protease family)
MVKAIFPGQRKHSKKELFLMTTQSNFLERYAVTLFLILTPLISIPIVLFVPLPPAVVIFVAAFIPTLMAILLIAMIEGGKGVTALLRKLIQWRINLKWYVVALGLPLVIQLAMSLLGLIIGWIPTIQIRLGSPMQQLILAVIILILAVFEELGWRGYALPGLLTHRSALFSALLIGISWGAIHIGIGALENRPWLPTFLTPFGTSVLFTWLFLHSRGSLVPVVLFHFGLNYFTFFNEGMTIDKVVWLQAIVTLALDLILILLFGVDLRRDPVKSSAAVD